jgi:probable HAF family extracellular repeat protein
MHRRKFIGMSGVFALAAATGLPRLDAHAQAAYSAVDLGIPDGFDSVVPVALNNNGVAVVGAIGPDSTGVFIVENGTFTQAGEPGESAIPTSINDANVVGGWVEGASDGSTDNPDIPILMTTDGQIELPGNRLVGRVYALTSDGRAAGEAAVDEEHAALRAVIWDNQEVQELKGTPDGGASGAYDLNSLGQIVGWIGSEDGNDRKAVLFSLDEDPVELGTLGGSLSEAIAISEQGMIVGNSTTSDEQTELAGNGVAAFSWVDGTITALHTLENQAWSTVADVNSFGLVAGTVGLAAPATASAATVAVVWAPDAVLDLNQIVQPIEGLTLTAAVAINEMGQVLCKADDAEGISHAVLLSVLGN